MTTERDGGPKSGGSGGPGRLADVPLPMPPQTPMFKDATLRDYFAAHALEILIPKAMDMIEFKENGTSKERRMTNAEYIAMNAYQIADAMLNEREGE